MTILIILTALIVLTGVIFFFYARRKKIIKLTTDEYNLLASRKFDRYELRSFLVRGDFNSTFVAFDPVKNKTVAIRILHRKLIYNDQIVKHFLFKGEMLKFLSERYPGNSFVQNINYGTTYVDDEPRQFIVTDYVNGVTLAEILDRFGKLSPKDTYTIISQLAKTLSSAHSQRIWIRDLSPGNIVLTIDDSGGIIATLANVGVAFKELPTDEAAQFKQAYYAPEDRKGDYVSAASDIYALASLTFRMLEGFDLSQRNEGQPWSGISSVLETPLNEDPNKRPSSIDNFLKSIESIQSHKSSVKDQRWIVVISNLLKNRTEFKIKHSGKESLARTQQKKQLLPQPTRDKLVSAFITGLVAAFFLWIGKKIESVLASPKKAVKAVAIGVVLLAVALWYFVFAPAKTLLSITTEPVAAIIYLNGIQLGKQTPLEDYSVDSGGVSIKIQKEGYFTKDTSIWLSEGKKLSLAFILDSAANVSMSIIPPDAIVVIDDDTIPQFQFQNFEMSIGQHQLSISRDGYQGDSRTINLKKGRNDLRYTLSPLEATTPKLRITSDVHGANIIINNQLVGVTPYDDWKLAPGSYRVKVTYEGYKDTSFNVTIQPNKPIAIDMTMTPAGILNLTSLPEGANVEIGGKSVGTTPLNNFQIAAAKHKFKLYRSGFKDFDTVIAITQKQTHSYAINLIPLTGKLKVRVKPFGSIDIDGLLKKTDTEVPYTTDLAAGDHRLKVTHPSYGSWENEIQIKQDELLEIMIDFDKFVTLTVTAYNEDGNPVKGEIFVDDKSEGKYTPATIKARCGKRKIEVRLKDYASVEGPKILNLEKDITQPIKFILKKLK
ncbi:MAG: PEGA domain-containing protein [Bacteroidota bacterium]|nr:PEGA domain-containing protein [Bacteroidota bacterium]